LVAGSLLPYSVTARRVRADAMSESSSDDDGASDGNHNPYQAFGDLGRQRQKNAEEQKLQEIENDTIKIQEGRSKLAAEGFKNAKLLEHSQQKKKDLTDRLKAAKQENEFYKSEIQSLQTKILKKQTWFDERAKRDEHFEREKRKLNDQAASRLPSIIGKLTQWFGMREAYNHKFIRGEDGKFIMVKESAEIREVDQDALPDTVKEKNSSSRVQKDEGDVDSDLDTPTTRRSRLSPKSKKKSRSKSPRRSDLSTKNMYPASVTSDFKKLKKIAKGLHESCTSAYDLDSFVQANDNMQEIFEKNYAEDGYTILNLAIVNSHRPELKKDLIKGIMQQTNANSIKSQTTKYTIYLSNEELGNGEGSKKRKYEVTPLLLLCLKNINTKKKCSLITELLTLGACPNTEGTAPDGSALTPLSTIIDQRDSKSLERLLRSETIDVAETFERSIKKDFLHGYGHGKFKVEFNALTYALWKYTDVETRLGIDDIFALLDHPSCTKFYMQQKSKNNKNDSEGPTINDTRDTLMYAVGTREPQIVEYFLNKSVRVKSGKTQYMFGIEPREADGKNSLHVLAESKDEQKAIRILKMFRDVRGQEEVDGALQRTAGGFKPSQLAYACQNNRLSQQMTVDQEW